LSVISGARGGDKNIVSKTYPLTLILSHKGRGISKKQTIFSNKN
jgi:hypothetical protein